MLRISILLLALFCGVSAQTNFCSSDVQRWVINDPVQAKSLASAANCFGGNFEVEWNGRVQVDETIRVLDGTIMTITGADINGNAFIDGGGNTQIFYVENAELHLEDVTVGNGVGSAIQAFEKSILSFNRTKFVGNKARLGGAVYIDESTASCSDTIFDSNTALYGGAIFMSNSSATCGGSWTNNSADFGGSILVRESILTWNEDTIFDSNTAKESFGGALLIASSTVSWSDCTTTFLSNVAILGGAIASGVSSNISWSGTTNFDSNNAIRTGGALHITDDSTISWTNVSTFTNNTAIVGGAVYLADSELSCTDSIANFVNNRAEGNLSVGGALYMNNSIFSLEGVNTFTNNSATDSGGSAIDAQFSTIYWEGDMIFSNNTGVLGVVTLSESDLSWTGNTDFIGNSATSGSGALYVADDSTVGWNSDLNSGITRFINNRGVGGGAIFIRHFCSVGWGGANTEFIGNYASLSGGAILVDGSGILGWWGDTIFDSNEASEGGAISRTTYLYRGEGRIWVLGGSTVFSRNSANNGGGMALQETDFAVFESAEIRFVENKASTSGGAVFLSNSGEKIDKLSISNISFVGNVAAVGGAISTFGSITYFENCSFIENVGDSSGGAINIAAGESDIINSVFERNSATRGAALNIVGEVSVNNCSFIQNESDEGQGAAINNIGLVKELQNNSFVGNTYDCHSETFLEFIESDDPISVLCVGCNEECVNCLVEGTVPTCTDTLEHSESDGANTTLENISIVQGFWRATSTSREVLSCHNEDACVGGVTGSQSYCEEGYEGPYCSICSEGYSEHLSFSCRECSDNNTDTIIVAVILSVVGLIVVVALASYLTSSETDSSLGISGVVKRYIPLQSLKIVIVTWQILTQFSSVANVTYPDVYQDFLDGLDFFNFDFSWILSAGCVVRIDFHDRLLASTIGPIVALAFLACTYTAASHVHRGKTDVLQRIDDKHMSMVLLLTFLVYSNVSSVLFKAFACEDLDDDKYYLRADYRIECDSSEHVAYQIYAGIMILVYTVGIPAMYGYLLFRDRDVLKTKCRGEDSSRIEAISDLWEPYRSNVFYYELIECTRRILLSSVVVFIYPNTSAQIAITILISFSFVVIFEAMSPYVSPWDRWISRLGQVVVFISMYVALLLKVDVSGERYSSQQAFEGILVAVHVFMVLLVIIESVVTLCYLKHEKVQDLEGPVPRGASTSTLSNSQERSEECSEELSI